MLRKTDRQTHTHTHTQEVMPLYTGAQVKKYDNYAFSAKTEYQLYHMTWMTACHVVI